MAVRKVILIGTEHEYQHLDSPYRGEFCALIRTLHKKYGAEVIAEEMHQAFLKNGHKESVLHSLSDELNIEHQYSDLSPEQRQQLGVKKIDDIRLHGFIADWNDEQIKVEVRRSHDIRERYWLYKLCETNKWPAIFVCGACHVEFFSDLLKTRGIEVEIPFNDWRPSGKPA